MPESGRRAAPAWRRKAGLADAELDGERVVWDPGTGQVSRLDRIGSLVWTYLDGTTLEEMADDLAAVFAVPRDVVRLDMRDLLSRLQEMGLVVEEQRPSL